MATSSYQTYLMIEKDGTGSAKVWEKLIDVKTVGDLGGTPELLDTTTLSDSAKTSINGIQSQEAIEFEANFDKTELAKLQALTGEHRFGIFMGGTTVQTATDGAYSFTGTLSAYIKGFGVNEVRSMTISIAPSSVVSAVSA